MSAKFNAAFWRWFGDSKVVDAKGKPLVVYHGTDELWTKPRSRKERLAHFDKMTEGLTDSIVVMQREYVARSAGAIWWTDDEGVAEGYRDSYKESSGIIEAYLRIENPLDLRAKTTGASKIARILTEIYGKETRIDDTYGEALGVARAIVWDNSKVVKWAIENGFDGIIHDDTDIGGRNTHTSYVTFEPSQIKSADNDGTWDADDPDIRSNPPDLNDLARIAEYSRDGFFREYGTCKSAGNCEEMSEFLYDELIAESYDPVLVAGTFKVSNRKDDSSMHTWVEVGGVIVDISADQFGPTFPKVWINAPRKRYIEIRRYFH